jgi:hypothetical protein
MVSLEASVFCPEVISLEISASTCADICPDSGTGVHVLLLLNSASRPGTRTGLGAGSEISSASSGASLHAGINACACGRVCGSSARVGADSVVYTGPGANARACASAGADSVSGTDTHVSSRTSPSTGADVAGRPRTHASPGSCSRRCSGACAGTHACLGQSGKG